MTNRIFTALSGGILLLAVTACNTTPVEAPLQVSGTPASRFGADEAQCRAEARRIGQGHIAQTAAIVGAGGALGGAIESSDKALAGAVLGAAVGAEIGDAEVNEAQRNYLVRCMQQRGHAVTG